MATRGVTELDQSQGEWAVRFARKVVDSTVSEGSPPSDPSSVDPIFEKKRGAFVTLEKGGELRGCIGRPRPEQRAVRAIREAAVGAATNDPRFPPVTESELDSITVEVSVLTAPQQVSGDEATELPEAIAVGRDGLIVDREGLSGLLLPQVAVDRGWDAEEFLVQTCRKARLPGDAWREPDTEVRRFSAQVFVETEPYGPIEAVPLSDGQGL